MAYATLQDLENRFGEAEINQLADRDNDGNNDTDVVESALDSATSEINSYLGVRYSTPITSVSDNLNRVCCDIARYLLHDDAAIDEVESRYKRAISWLKDIASGKAILTDDTGTSVSSNSGATSVKYESSERQFTDATMAGY